MVELLAAKSADALEPVPEEGPDPARVVVEPHLPVGADVEAAFYLVRDDAVHRIAKGLLVVKVLESFPDVAAEQLLAKPRRARIGADHRGRKECGDRVHDAARIVLLSYRMSN